MSNEEILQLLIQTKDVVNRLTTGNVSHQRATILWSVNTLIEHFKSQVTNTDG